MPNIQLYKRMLIILLILSALPAVAQLSEPLPYSPFQRTHGNIEVGWYASSEIYKYLADVNVLFDFASWNDVQFGFRGGILTLIKTTDDDSFQPDRYRGTLEPIAYLTRDRNVYAFSIRHQSFHTIDRAPTFEESYELYNLSYQHMGEPNITFAIGKYLNKQDVDYDWDYFLDISSACIGRCSYGTVYFDVTGHFVTETGGISDRDNFFDYNLEVGIQSNSGVRYFTAYRQIHDIDQFDGITDNQWIIGLKYLW